MCALVTGVQTCALPIYWRYGDYAGIGPGAHGRRGGSATVRHRKPENWMNAVTLLGHGLVEESPLTPADRAREALLMGLRLADGIDPLLFEHRTGVALDRLIAGDARARLAAHGLIDGGQKRQIGRARGRARGGRSG